MSNEIQIYEIPAVSKDTDINDFRTHLQNFIKLVEREPDKDSIQKFSQGTTRFEYVDIDSLETLLNTYFFGLWNWTIDDVQIVGNEIITRGTLEVFHPSAGVWIKRAGIGACQIRIKKDAELLVQNKIKNALTMDAPHSAAEAFKNACLTLGRKFGRGLRRDYTKDYSGFDLEQANPELDELQILLADFTDPDELLKKTDSLLKDLKDKKKGSLLINKKYDQLRSK